MAAARVPARQSPKQDPIPTKAQLELVDAVSRYQHSFCVECGERFPTQAQAYLHREVHEFVLDYFDRAPVN